MMIRQLLSGRYMGKPFPVGPTTCIEILGKFVDTVRAVIHDPEAREQAAHKQACAVHKTRQKDRTASAYAAVREAKELLKLAVLRWKCDWKRACTMAHLSERTADNLLVLLAFYQQEKDPNTDDGLFGLFAKLGRTKLYHIARLPRALLKTLTPETPVTVGTKTVPLAYLSDRELLAFLRTLAPVPRRKQISGLRKNLAKCLAFVDDDAKMAAITANERALVRAKTQELFRKVENAVKNAP
jgi:hypothetical protein